jgi:hypothetical protein
MRIVKASQAIPALDVSGYDRLLEPLEAIYVYAGPLRFLNIANLFPGRQAIWIQW